MKLLWLEVPGVPSHELSDWNRQRPNLATTAWAERPVPSSSLRWRACAVLGFLRGQSTASPFESTSLWQSDGDVLGAASSVHTCKGRVVAVEALTLLLSLCLERLSSLHLDPPTDTRIQENCMQLIAKHRHVPRQMHSHRTSLQRPVPLSLAE